MLVNFADIQFDKYDRIETPTLVLKHMDGRVISTIGAYHSLSATFRYNDVSEISFEVPAKIEIEGKLVDNPYYDEVLGMRLVNVEPFGDFILSNPQVSNDGLKESKACKAYSLEYAFNKKQINIPTGTYNFYNPADNADTIMTIITEIVPDWSIGEVDRDLIGRWRTFDNIDDGLYSFMMNTLQKTYNCLFQFDCRNKKINVISADRKPIHSPIHLSYDNLIKSARITELSDEVITSLAGYGSGDNMSIAYVNPNGTDRIYNLDYLINHGDIEDKLADRWIAYRDSCDFYQKAFGNLEALRIEKTSAYMLAEAQLKIIEKDIKALEGSIISSKADTTVEGWETHVKKLEADLAALKLKYEDQQAVVKKYNTDKEKVQTQLKEIMDICKLDAYFTEDELKTLSMFFKEDTIVEDSFVVPSYNSALKGDESSTITERSESMLKLTGTVVESSNIAEIVGTDENGNFVGVDTDNSINIADTDRHDQVETNEITQDIANSVAQQLNENKNKYVYSLRGGSLEFTQKVFTVKNGKEEVSDRLIKGSIVSASFQYNVDNLSSYVDEASPEITKKGYFLLTVALRNAYQNDVFYPSMNITLSGKIKGDAPQITDDFIGFNITTGTFYNTVGVTEFQQQQVYQELFDYVKDALKKLSEPSYQFSIDSANFVFAKTFEAFKNKLTLGKTISADINGDSDLETIVYPILIEVSFSYDDINNFSLTFSDKYKLSCPEFKFADLFGETVTSSKSLDLNKASYNSFVNSGASGAIDSLTNDAYDVAKKAIINSTNQGMEWNENGLYLRKKVNGGFDPEQIAMINNMIAFTGDGWDSVKLAIGKFKDTNVGDTWGIAAPNITGTLFAGKNLVIENTVTNKDGTKVVKQFKVDGTGAWLNNSALYFAQDLIEGKTGGKMILDPMYGFAAGNAQLFSGEGKNIKPSFIGENGEMLYDTLYENKNPDGTMVKIQVPKNSSFFFNINNGNSYFKGDIYATNGYFAGTINAQNIIAGTLNGNVIQNGTINAGDKLTGDIQLPQMYKNVIEAVNECIKFQETVGGGKLVQINQAAIGNLNADKITAGDIATDRLTTNIIEAINGGKGLINADKVQAGSMVAGSLIISGENGRLAIDPKYGIVAGNRDIFQIGEDGKISTPTFVDETGNLIFDKDASAPKNASFYFDINTGKAYFSGKLSASDITTGKLSSDYLFVKDGFITNAMINNLSADKIVSGQIRTDILSATVVQAINMSAERIQGDKLIFADGYIQSAWIGSLSADKLTAGRINTQQIQIGYGDVGKEALLISDKLIQWRDKNHKIRLQAGQDKSGNYTFAVFGEDGKTAYFDEAGINAEGIKENILVDNMFKSIDPNGSYQGISGDKLNISSVISAINSDTGETTINSGRINFDGKTFTAVIGEITTDFNGKINETNSKIETNAKSIQAQVDKFEQFTTENSKTIESLKNDISLNTEGIKLSAQEMITKIDGIQIGGNNLLLDTKLLNNTKDNDYKYALIYDSVTQSYLDPVADNKTGFNYVELPADTQGNSTFIKWITWINSPILKAEILDKETVLSFEYQLIKEYETSDSPICVEYYITDKIGGGRVYYGLFYIKSEDLIVNNTFEWNKFELKKIITDELFNNIQGETTEISKESCPYVVVRIYGNKAYNLKMRKFKFEKGNKATDWTPAQEDINKYISDVENGLEDKIKDLDIDIEKTSSSIDVLSDKISNLVRSFTKKIYEVTYNPDTKIYTKTDKVINPNEIGDPIPDVTTATGEKVYEIKISEQESLLYCIVLENQESLMEQTDDGWSFNISSITNNINTIQNNLDKSNEKQNKIDAQVQDVNSNVDKLTTKTASIDIGAKDGSPTLELSSSQSEFKVVITNKSIDFINGNKTLAYASGDRFYAPQMVTSNSIQIGETPGFRWERRTSGNLGLVYIE